MKKILRKKDRTLLDEVKKLPCLICKDPNTDPCHIKSVGAGGNDESGNILPFCRAHHSEQHALGWHRFVEKHPGLENVLNEYGWGFVNEFGVMKLRRLGGMA